MMKTLASYGIVLSNAQPNLPKTIQGTFRSAADHGESLTKQSYFVHEGRNVRVDLEKAKFVGDRLPHILTANGSEPLGEYNSHLLLAHAISASVFEFYVSSFVSLTEKQLPDGIARRFGEGVLTMSVFGPETFVPFDPLKSEAIFKNGVVRREEFVQLVSEMENNKGLEQFINLFVEDLRTLWFSIRTKEINRRTSMRHHDIAPPTPGELVAMETGAVFHDLGLSIIRSLPEKQKLRFEDTIHKLTTKNPIVEPSR